MQNVFANDTSKFPIQAAAKCLYQQHDLTEPTNNMFAICVRSLRVLPASASTSPRRHTPTAKQIAVLILTKRGGLAVSFNIYIRRGRYRARFIPSQYGTDEE